uniref:Branched-chain-amino-acid transaminase n=1 Tax=Strigomonas galati TaxID=1003336 RepID=U5KLZ1_9TRYP|nr:branched-chain-amino-acid transaminase [Strigomonas galati]
MLRTSFSLRQQLQKAVASFKAADLKKELAPNPPPLRQMDNVVFGSYFTPHMMTIDFENGKWHAPEIKPFQDFSLSPQSAVLHYAMTCFEGMKAYADAKDIERVAAGETLTQQRVRLFRPMKNIERFQTSMARLCFPPFDKEEFQQLLDEYVRTEASYVPKKMGYSLYLRPTAMGIGRTLSAAPSNIVRVFVIASPVGPYYATAGKDGGVCDAPAVKLLVEEAERRAWPGGTGAIKLGLNYGISMHAQAKAQQKGYSQVLWLGPNREVQEAGSMNFLVLWHNKQTGELELNTAPLDGSTLPGITRDSVIQLAKSWGYKVKEEAYTIEDMIDAIADGRMVECFGCGTAAVITPVSGLHYRDADFTCPTPKDGGLAGRLLRELLDIQYGQKVHEWSHLVETLPAK